MEVNAVDFQRVGRHIHHLLSQKCLRVTPSDLVRALAAHFPDVSRPIFRATIREMVQKGLLTYTSHFSSSYLELGMLCRKSISLELSLGNLFSQKPSMSAADQVRVKDGAAFGQGDHPTTQLAIEAIDWISGVCQKASPSSVPAVLDIGTGTGILAMVAVRLGLGPAVAIDLDRLACCEAMKNVHCNGLSLRIHVVAGELAAIRPSPYKLILANLRPPTLVRLMPDMVRHTGPEGYWILTGFRPDEKSRLFSRLPMGFEEVWVGENRGWGAVAIQRR
jgi:ribosomal protein L11 methyltransferase